MQGITDDIENKIRERMRVEYEESLREDVTKIEKQLKLNLKKKLDQERKGLEEFYEMEWKGKISSQKKLLEKDKSDLARLKSLSNLR